MDKTEELKADADGTGELKPMSRAERRAMESPREQRAKSRKRNPNPRPGNKQKRPTHVVQIPDWNSIKVIITKKV